MRYSCSNVGRYCHPTSGLPGAKGLRRGALFCRFKSAHDVSPNQFKTSPLICRANQWIGFYVIGTTVMTALNLQFILGNAWISITLFNHFPIYLSILDTFCTFYWTEWCPYFCYSTGNKIFDSVLTRWWWIWSCCQFLWHFGHKTNV